MHVSRVTREKKGPAIVITCYQRFLPGLDIGHTLIVLETEGRFVAFGDFIAARIDYIESGEYFHRVIMPAKGKWSPQN